jgi:hypothetical protein
MKVLLVAGLVILGVISIVYSFFWCCNMADQKKSIFKHLTRKFRMLYIIPKLNSFEHIEEIEEYLKGLDDNNKLSDDIIYIAKNKRTSKKVLTIIYNNFHLGYKTFIIQNENCPSDCLNFNFDLFKLLSKRLSKKRRMTYEEVILNHLKANIAKINLYDWLRNARERKCPFSFRQKIINCYKQYKELT